MGRKVRSKERIVKAMAVVIRRDFRAGKTPSPFTYEAQFIADLRSALCLAGWPWRTADRAARDVVAEALRGIMRPSWAEGQPGYTKTETVVGALCAECGEPLIGGVQQKYCSVRCKSAANNRRMRAKVA